VAAWATLLGIAQRSELVDCVVPGLGDDDDVEPPLWSCGEQARAGGRFGDIPVIVLSAGIQGWEEDPKLDNKHALKLKLQHA